MSKKPFFSIITASYNSEKTIGDTIQSVLDLNFDDFEYLIIDGNSIDNTVKIIESFREKFESKGLQYKFVSEPDKGIYDAWNKGVKLSNGEWISFLGSDDVYLTNALSVYFNTINESDKDINFISSKVEIVDAKGKVLRTFGVPFSFKGVVTEMNIAQVGSFHHRSLFSDTLPFSLDYKIVSDLDFYLKHFNRIKPFFIDEVTAKMGNEGVSNKIHEALNEALKVRLKYKYNSSVEIYCNHYILMAKCYWNKFLKK